MRKPQSVKALENLGRVRLSPSFFMRDFLHSEIANFHGLPNIPDDPDAAIAVGRKLCTELLEPLNATFGRIAIRSAYRSCIINQFGNEHGYNCASNEANYAGPHLGQTRRRRLARCHRLHRAAMVYQPLRTGHRLARTRLLDTRPPALQRTAILPHTVRL
jgi:hypothetical protein